MSQVLLIHRLSRFSRLMRCNRTQTLTSKRSLFSLLSKRQLGSLARLQTAPRGTRQIQASPAPGNLKRLSTNNGRVAKLLPSVQHMRGLNLGLILQRRRCLSSGSSNTSDVLPWAEYGSWESPLSTNDIVQESIELSDAQFYNDSLYFIEARPSEDGRMCLVKHDKTTTTNIDVIPSTINSRSTVHEYGGGSYCVLPNSNNDIVTCNFDDQRLYFISGTDATDHYPITALYESSDGNTGTYKYSDMVAVPATSSESAVDRVVCIRQEDVVERAPDENVNVLVSVDINTGVQNVLCSGHDFYTTPRINSQGAYMAYVSWDFNNMPWDYTNLHLCQVDTSSSDSGFIVNDNVIGTDASIIAPAWDPSGENLYYISDEGGYWNIYQYNLTNQTKTNMTDENYEFGHCQWDIRSMKFDFVDDNNIIARGVDGSTGNTKIFNVVINGTSSTINSIQINNDDEQEVTQIGEVLVDSSNKNVFILGGSPTMPAAIFSLQFDYNSGGSSSGITINNDTFTYITEKKETIASDNISVPEHVEYPTTESSISRAFIYYPKNASYDPSQTTSKPPLLVMAHGGPTSATNAVYNEFIQFYTTRGWAVADVNYRGSSGYGTPYRNALKPNWGIYDVDDACNVANHLVSENKVDDSMLAIRGGSAGGYTTLSSLTFRDVFSAGCSRYGIGDLNILATETHKFESHYLEGLLGEDEAVYYDRSPINFAEQMSAPVIFLHGSEDKVVPPNQAETMYNALVDNDITACLEIFEGEQHGFRIEENIIAATDYEYVFYSEILGFPLSSSDEANMNKPDITWGSDATTDSNARGNAKSKVKGKGKSTKMTLKQINPSDHKNARK